MNQEQWLKIGKGALIAIGGALIAYIPQAIDMVDWGQWLPFVVALSSILINALRVGLKKVSDPTVTYSIEEHGL